MGIMGIGPIPNPQLKLRILNKKIILIYKIMEEYKVDGLSNCSFLLILNLLEYLF